MVGQVRYLVDTSAYSLAQKNAPEAVRLFSAADQLVVTAVVLGELRFGFMNGSKPKQNEQLLQQFLDSPRTETLPMNEDTSRYYATIRSVLMRAGTPISPNDMWIAASAMQHGLTVLTADTDFQKIPQVIVELLNGEP